MSLVSRRQAIAATGLAGAGPAAGCATGGALPGLRFAAADAPSPSGLGDTKDGLDIPLVFDNTAAPGAISGDGADARAMAAVMSETLIAFARSGDPSNPAIPDWPRYDLDDRATMIFDLPPRTENDPRGNERRLFSIVPYVQPGT